MPQRNLSRYFRPNQYLLENNDGNFKLTIIGQKLPPPNHRISLHQIGLKILSAKIIKLEKQGPLEINVDRINHLPSFEQVRLHTNQILYPGRYQIELNFSSQADLAAELKKGTMNRKLLPSIDEAEAWQNAKLEAKS
jgi:hypothetical protein